DRGLGGIGAAAAARGASGDAPTQRRRQGRGNRPRTGAQHAAYATGPDHRWRGAWQRSLRHAAGDVDWPRRLALYYPRQYSARQHGPARNDDAAGGLVDPAARDASTDILSTQRHRARLTHVRWHAQSDEDLGAGRYGGRHDHDAGPL